MINTINSSCYYNYSKANKHSNKSEDKIKNTENENKNGNNTLISKHKSTIEDIYIERISTCTLCSFTVF